jgi:hypothetical protein
MRAITSLLPPAVNGTLIVTGLDGRWHGACWQARSCSRAREADQGSTGIFFLP